MAGRDLKRRPDAKAVKPPESQKEEPEKQAPEHQQELEKDVGSQEQASQLGSAVGNSDLQRMLNDSGRMTRGGEQETGQGLEEEGGSLEAEEGFAEFLEGMTLGAHQSGARDGADLNRLLGGDPEDEGPPRPQKSNTSRQNRIPRGAERDQGAAPSEMEDLLQEELPPLADAGTPMKDERLGALWPWIQRASAFARPHLRPEDLSDAGVHGRPQRMGAFLAKAGSAPLTRWLATLARPMPGPISGGVSSGSVSSGSATLARAVLFAELAALSEARLLPLAVVDRACALVLEDDVAARARKAAKICLEQRKLRGSLVLEVALHGQELGQSPPLPAPGLRGLQLLEAALREDAEPQAIVTPGRHGAPMDTDLSADSATEAIDALMANLLGGEPAPRMSEERVALVLDGADDLLLVAGRTQIELAAAAIAVSRISGAPVQAKVMGAMRATDRELRLSAREIAMASGAVDQVIGLPYPEAQAAVREAEGQLESLAARLRRLREAGLGTLAWASTGAQVSRQPLPIKNAESPAQQTPEDVLDALEELERTPLLGPGLDRALALERRAASLLPPNTPKLRARLLHRRGERLLQAGEEAAAEVLASAASAARSAGLPDRPARMDVVRALCARGQHADAQAVFDLAVLKGQPAGLREALAQLALGAPLALSALQAQLHTGTPELQLQALEHLALALNAQGQGPQAAEALTLALRIAEEHHDRPAAERLVLATAIAYLHHAQPHLADRYLDRAAAASDRIVSMAALALRPRSLWDCGVLAGHARAHRNWTAWQLAVIDAHHVCHKRNLQLARMLLVGGLALLRTQGEPGSLLQARVLESISDYP
ncbi:MAG: tetratricopeptide (TPR) repeat protein [Cognaticolwellia sp.]|jgi:tetratricopeptide (TPR) repeat protein